MRCYNNGREERTIKKLGGLKQSYRSPSTGASVRLAPTVITNCASGFPGHQRWYGEGDSPSAGKADIWRGYEAH